MIDHEREDGVLVEFIDSFGLLGAVLVSVPLGVLVVLVFWWGCDLTLSLLLLLGSYLRS